MKPEVSLKLSALLTTFSSYENNLGIVFILNEEQNFITFNSSCKKFLGGLNLNDSITEHLLLRDEEAAVFIESIRLNQSYKLKKVPVRLPSKTEIILDINTTPLYNDDLTKSTAVLVSIEDLTEISALHRKYNKTIERLKFEGDKLVALNHQLSEYERMANASKDCITLIDNEYRYVAANKNYLEKRNITEEKLYGQKVFSIWGDFIFNTIIKNSIDRCMKGSHINTQSWIDFGDNGKEQFVDVTYSPFYSDENKITHVVVTSHDITDLKVNEMELQKSLTAAEAAKDAKANFLSNMSHEIRTPMNAIMALSEDLRDSQLDDDQKDNIETIHDSANSLLRIINDILDFSKVEAGKLEIEFIDFNLRNCIDQLVKIFNHKTQNCEIDFSTLMSINVPYHVKGDPGRIKQILINLINNAIKFTKEGEVTVQINKVKEDDENIYIKFNVKDTGIGISEENLKNLFKPFSQSSSDTTRKFGGTGLGLSISKQLTELMHGEIGCESEISKGSTFWFEVPFKKSELENTHTQLPQQESNLHQHNTQVFMLTHEDPTLNNYKVFMKSWGYQLNLLHSINEFEHFIQQPAHKSSLFIIKEEGQKNDLSEPTLAYIKENQIHILLITDQGRKGDARFYQDKGFGAYLTLPIEMNQVMHALSCVEKRTPDEPIISKHALIDFTDKVINVLVVDDNLTNLKVANKILTKTGYQVDLAKNGNEAVEICQQKPYHVILMDLRMPEIDGFMATQKIHETGSKNEHTPIIALTADYSKEVEAKCRNVGMVNFIAKPFNRVILIDAVNDAVFKNKN